MAALEGRIGPNGGIVVDDPMLPPELQGKEAPSWWTDEADPTWNMYEQGTPAPNSEF